MNLIAQQQYFKVVREITSIDKREVEHDRMIHLYSHKVVTEHREFPIEEVIDMSYRKIGNEGGLLYIHTTRGLFSYTVKTSTDEFINAFKKHKLR